MVAKPAKKTTASKSKTTAKKNAPFEVTLDLARVTKNTYRFETDDEDAPINPLYVKQSAFDSEPSSITVTVTPS